MHENEIAKLILDSAFKIHKEIGPGLLEPVYEELLVQNRELFIKAPARRGGRVIKSPYAVCIWRAWRFPLACFAWEKETNFTLRLLS